MDKDLIRQPDKCSYARTYTHFPPAFPERGPTERNFSSNEFTAILGSNDILNIRCSPLAENGRVLSYTCHNCEALNMHKYGTEYQWDCDGKPMVCMSKVTCHDILDDTSAFTQGGGEELLYTVAKAPSKLRVPPPCRNATRQKRGRRFSPRAITEPLKSSVWAVLNTAVLYTLLWE